VGERLEGRGTQNGPRENCLFIIGSMGFELILARQAVLLLEPLHQLIFGVGFLGIGSQELFAQG
jgi:hypothetical protein